MAAPDLVVGSANGARSSATNRIGARLESSRWERLRFCGGMPPPRNLDDLPSAELKALVLELLAEVRALKEVVAQQRAEIARLKGLKGPPSIKPSGMEKASEAKPRGGATKRRGRGRWRMRVAVEDRV